MAAPTITWYESSGAGPTNTAITTLDFGNVQAGDWTDAKVIYANFSSSANSLRFWLHDTTADNGGTSTPIGSGANWKHQYTIDETYINPSTISDAVKSGTATDTNGNTWGVLPESQPANSDAWDNPSVGDQGAGTGGNTDYIFQAVQPPGTAADGLTDQWGYRLSFLYP